MTLDVYADLFDDDLDAVGRAMDSLLLRENVAKHDCERIVIQSGVRLSGLM